MAEAPGVPGHPPDPDVRLDQAHLDELSSLAGDTPGEAVAIAHSIFRRIKMGAGADEIAGMAERAARQLDALVEDGSSAIAFSAVILGLRWSDRLDLAERLLERAITIARRRGSMLDFANSLDLRAELYMRRGLLGEAEADARDSLATEIEKSWLFARGVKPLLQSLAGQGRTGEAEQIIGREFGDIPLAEVPPMIGLARAEVLAAAGKHAAALEAFEEAVRRGWGGASPSQIGDILIAAHCYHVLGDERTARARVAEAGALARRWDTPGALGEVMHAKGMLEVGDVQLEMLKEAAALLERSPARLELARALVDLGGALRRAGQRRDSRDPLRDAYELARDCGSEPLATTAQQELAASGVRVRRERLTGAQSLTPSERRIAQMVVDGGSNAEIAQALFITVKTVEMHHQHLPKTRHRRPRGASARAERASTTRQEIARTDRPLPGPKLQQARTEPAATRLARSCFLAASMRLSSRRRQQLCPERRKPRRPPHRCRFHVATGVFDEGADSLARRVLQVAGALPMNGAEPCRDALWSSRKPGKLRPPYEVASSLI